MNSQFSDIVRLSAFKAYQTRYENYWSEHQNKYNNRNRLLEELNTEHGYVERVGVDPTSRRNFHDDVYTKKYDDIEKPYEDWKDRKWDEIQDWKKSYGFTVYEYLFFEDTYTSRQAIKKDLLAKANMTDFNQF